LSLPDNFEIAEIKAPTACHGRMLQDLELANRYELRLITIRRDFEETGDDGAPCIREHILGVPKPETTIESTDTLVVFGSLEAVKKFLDING
jgi:trk system potassium uptake protein TrkA